MILTCPACRTRYRIDDAALGGAGGRRLRCAGCGNTWQYVHAPPAEPAQTADAASPEIKPESPAAPELAAAPRAESAAAPAEPVAEPAATALPMLEEPEMAKAVESPAARAGDAAAEAGPPELHTDAPADAPPAVSAPRLEIPAEPAPKKPAAAAATPSEPRIEIPKEPAAAGPIPTLRAEPSELAKPGSTPAPSRSAADRPDGKAAARIVRFRPSWPVAAGVGAAALAAVIALMAVLARDGIMVLWPQTTPLYAGLNLASPPGAGLAVTVKPTRTADALVINGDIVNGAAVSRRVPRLRVTLRGGDKSDVASKIIDPPVATLPPGATAHFNTTFEHPSGAATGVAVSFASP